ncbi:PLP-dependent lyase/thiolase [Parachryseolinea silvisoli]|uniref:PLP-dependent lyase/thiolase n=1 Tax=Parachryseolinea silvisoli TaxID=2873601 RepID=UPI002265C453|nr:PLP-dependent lyase/thiolase [Parachryseolinea silvisoli]MCD9019147.1 PLP-dependent lyase/thiolase [Parachryseolinea silvisoli]
MKSDINISALTPVEKINGLYFKRDDLFRPFSGLKVNGGKLRQCIHIVQSSKPNEIVTYSSMNSPQLGIVSAVGKHFGIPVKYLVGGSRDTEYLRLARGQGAEIIRQKPYRENYLFSQAKKISLPGSLLIKSGIIQPSMLAEQIDITSEQIMNLPDEIDTIVVSCGSGLTTLGLIKGISRYGKKVKKIWLISTAPDRREFIQDEIRTQKINSNIPKLNFYSLYDNGNFDYNLKKTFSIGDICFHPRYEAKTFSWFIQNNKFIKNKTLFWIVGSEIL